MKSRLKRAILFSLLLVLAVMVMIFCFSAETGDRSSRTSGRIADLVISLRYPDFETFSVKQQIIIRREIVHTVRKIAHFIEFFMLGSSLMLFFAFMSRKKPLRFPALDAFVIGVVYALLDELHQRFVAGRSSSPWDAALDTLGVLFGLIVVRVFFSLHKKKTEQG